MQLASIAASVTLFGVVYCLLLCRDTVQLYEQLRESGLQYGPAFRLLRNVHVPDTQQYD